MSMNKSLLVQSIKRRISHAVKLIPKHGKVKYLPLTNQLLITFDDENEFDFAQAEEICGKFDNAEVVTVKTGYTRYANFIFINQFNNPSTPLNEEQNNIIALKVLVRYAFKKETDRINSMIDNELYGPQRGRGEISEHEKIWVSKLRKSLAEISSTSLIRQINDLKNHTKNEQRNMLYWTLSTYGETAGPVELLLETLPKIDADDINFDYIKSLRHVEYPDDIDINLFEDKTSQHILNWYPMSAVREYSPMFGGIKAKKDQDINSLKIAKFDMTLSEFNKLYEGQYTIVKGPDMPWKGFWLAKNINDEICGVFFPEDNEFCETEYSKGKYNFTQSLIKTEYAASKLGYF